MKQKVRLAKSFVSVFLSVAMVLGLMPEMKPVQTRADVVSWTYSVSENVITATSEGGETATLELVADNATYNTQAIEAKIAKSDNWEAVDGDDVIEYSSGTAPVNAGSYTASVEIKPEGQDPVKVTKTYAIAKAEAQISVSMDDYNDTDTELPSPKATVKLADGTDVTSLVSLNYVYESNGDGTYKSSERPTAKGAYVVKANFSATQNLSSKNSGQAAFIVHGYTGVEVTMNDWSYDDEASNPTIKVVDIAGRDITESEEYVIGTNATATYYEKVSGNWTAPTGEDPEDVYEGYNKLSAKPTMPGSYMVVVKVSEVNNFLKSKGYSTFTISKDIAEVNVEIEDWEYGGTASTPTVSVVNKKGVDITSDYNSFTYLYTGETAKGVAYSSEEAPTEAGTYTLTVSVASTDKHLEASGSKEFKVLKKKNAVSVEMKDWTYDDQASTPSIKGLPEDCIYTVEYKYYTAESCSNASLTTIEGSGATVVGGIPKNAGTYWVKAVVDADNYTDENGESTFTIIKKFVIKRRAIVAPATNATAFTYNKEVQYYFTDETVTANAYYTVTANSRTNAGSQKVVLALKDNVNTYWKDATEVTEPTYDIEDKEYTFTIGKLKVEKPVVDSTKKTFVYSGEVKNYGGLSDQVADLVNNDATKYYSISGSEKIAAGTYTVIAALADKQNYEWKDGSTTDLVFDDFVITQQSVTIPAADNTVFVYDGDDKTYVIAANDLYTVANNVQKNAGTYDVTVALKDKVNYVWANSNGVTQTSNDRIYKFNIQKQVVAIPANQTYEYDNAEHGFNLNGATLYTMKDTSATPKKDIGEYNVYLALVDPDNYQWSNYSSEDVTVKFAISKKIILVPEEDNTVYTYNGTQQQYKLVTSDYYTIANDKKTAAGTYEVTVTLKDTTSSMWSDATTAPKKYSFVINKYSVTKPKSNTEVFTYNAQVVSYFGTDVTSNTLYTVSNNTRTNAGSQYVGVALNDKDNYQWSDGTTADLSYPFTIGKYSVTSPVATGTYTYNTYTQTFYFTNASLADIELFGGETYTILGNSGKNAGEYTATATLKDIDNFKWKDGTTTPKQYTFTIQKFPVRVVASNLSRDYRTPINSQYSTGAPYSVNSGNASLTFTSELVNEFNSKVNVSIDTPEYYDIQTPVKYKDDATTIDTYNIITSATYKPDVIENFAITTVNAKLTINPKDIAKMTGDVRVNEITLALSWKNDVIKYSGNYVSSGDYFVCDSNSPKSYFTFADVVYGDYVTPAVVINDRITENEMLQTTDYVITDTTSEKSYGTYTMTITGNGNYTGTYSLQWEIKDTVITPVVQLDSWYYLTAGKEPSVEGNLFNGTVEYHYYKYDNESYVELNEKPSNPGTYYIKALVKKTDQNVDTWTDYTEFQVKKPIIEYTLQNCSKTYGEYDPENFVYEYVVKLQEENVEVSTVYTDEQIQSLVDEVNFAPFRVAGEDSGTYIISATYDSTNIQVKKFNATMTIEKKLLTDDMVTIEKTNYTQPINDTKKITPVINISDVTEAEGTGFNPLLDAKPEGGTSGYELGVYTIYVNGQNNYTGTVVLTWAISNLADYKVTYDAAPHGFADANTLESETITDNAKKYSLTVNNYTGVDMSTGVEVAYDSEDAPTNVGEYVAHYTLYRKSDAKTFEGTANVTITPRDINDEDVVYTEGDALTYNGNAQTQSFTLSYKENAMTEGEGNDYTVEGNTQTESGEYALTVTGIGNFEGTRAFDYVIAKKDIADETVEVSIAEDAALTYNGAEQTQKVVIADGEADDDHKTVVEDADYTLSDNTAIDAGTYTLTITASEDGNYIGSREFSFDIAKKAVTVTANDQEKIYGDADAAFVLYDGETTEYSYTTSDEIYERDYAGTETGKLVFEMSRDNVGVDEDVKYSEDAVVPYEDYVHVALAADNANTNYEFTFVDGDFTINPKDINEIDFAYDGEMNNTDLGTLIYTGKQQTQEIIMTYETDETTGLGTRVFCSDTTNADTNTDSDITVTNNVGTVATNPNPYVMTITGTGNYTGTRTENFQIAKRSIEDATMDLGPALVYNGQKQTKTITGVYVNLSDGNKISVEYDIAAQTNPDGSVVVDEETGKPVLTNTSTSADASDDYQITIIGKGNFEGTTSKNFSIEKKNIADESVEVELNGTKFVYNSLVPEVKVETIVDNAIENSTIADNYTVNENTNCDAGSYELTIAGTGNYTGTRKAKYEITKRDITDAQFVFKYDLVYDGTNKTQEIDRIEIEDADAGTLDVTYKVIYTQSSSAAGNYSITVEGTGNYTGTAYGTYTVDAYDISKDDLYVGLGEKLTYNRLAQKQDIIEVQTSTGMNVTYQVQFDETTGRYTDTNIDAGDYEIILKGVGNFKGTYKVPYTIARLDISKDAAETEITLDNQQLIYNRLAQTKEVEGVTAKSLSGKNIGEVLDLEKETEYVIVDESNVATDAGNYTITIEGVGNFMGTRTIDFTIDQLDLENEEAQSAITLNEEQLIYNCLAQTKVIESVTANSIFGENKGDVLDVVAGEDYQIVDESNVAMDAGEYTITLEGIGNFKGTLTANFTIDKLDISKAEGSFAFAENQLVYNGEVQTKDVTSVTAKSISGENLGQVLTLENTKDYEIVANSNKATDAGTYTTKIVGIGNFTGELTKEFKIAERNIADAVITLEQDSYFYDATEKTPVNKVEVKLGNAVKELKENVDYTITYENNKEVGKAKATITGKGNYIGTFEKEFVIEEDFEQDKTWLNRGISTKISGARVRVKWGRVKYADGYEVYVVKCGKKAAFKGAPTKEIKNGKKKTCKIKGLKKGANYKVLVRAYRMVNGKKFYLAKSYAMHAADSKDKKRTNAKKIKVDEKQVTLKVNKTFKIKAKTVKVNKEKSLLGKKHARRYRYYSSRQEIAKVSKKGKIKAVGKGECVIYVFAQNGVKAKVKVTVK